MIIDCITYNGEAELFDLRYNILKDHAYEFIVVESDTTFSGNKKPLYFKEIQDKYPDVRYYVIDRNWTHKEIELGRSSKCTDYGKDYWMEEFLQKESIKKALTHLNDSDIVFVGDCDEIWNISGLDKLGQKLRLKVYAYWLNNLSTEKFAGGLFLPYSVIQSYCLNELRNFSIWTEGYHGWHFTSMAPTIERKFKDGYTPETYAHPAVMKNLSYNVKNNLDFLGRDFKYEIDELEWPEYLKNNREKYAHLMK